MENQIRNFVIISHIDHGKSTLADRFLELTGTIPKDKMKPQFLDSMDLEREKGITIKMQPCRMEYNGYILNLIDTPGHVDFSYEVSRSLAAVEGAIILVDATQGIQAQTISNLELAKAQNLVIIPVINKIDSPEARIEKTKQEIANLLNISEEEVLSISAKCGTNIKELLETVIKKIPSPETNQEKPLRALIFDSKYDAYKGIIAYVRVMDGKIETAQNFYLMASKSGEKVKEVGVFKPELFPKKELKAGEIGYIATGIKEPEKIKIGDTIISDKLLMINNLVEPLPGYLEPKPMVFASFYPTDPNDYQLLKEGLVKLKLNDASLFFEPERKEMLGRGFRCGFLGSLHAEIVSERLYRESGLDLIISTPSVVLKIINQKNQETLIYSASDLPCASEIKEILEPWIKLKIISPINYLNSIFEILKNLKSKYIDTKSISKDRVILIEEIPLREIIVAFYDKLKTQTHGYGSMNYEMIGYKPADLVKLEILINEKKEEAFSRIVARDRAAVEGKKIVEKLKKTLPFQLFSVPLQAVVSGKIIARETLKAKRKDVIAPLYGGDYTRKRKLLEKQKKGKKKLKEKTGIQIPAKVFLEMFKT